MKKMFQRLLVFSIGLPALLVVLLFLPQFNHLAFSMVVIAVSVIGAMELQNMLKQKGLEISVIEAAILGGLAPVMLMLHVSFGLFQGDTVFIFVSLGASWVLLSRVFSNQEKLNSYVNRVAAGFAVLIYPGLLMSWIVKMSTLENAGVIILVYLLVTFMNDSLAWVTGVLFGKGNQGIVAASPNKSVAGFIGGTAASVLLGAGAALIFPGVFGSLVMPNSVAGALLGLAAGIAATLGDLGESALKRSSGIKDSGFIIPGRGGILDSIDSLALAAPVYYLVFEILF
jgi:phosphatidate cytidylyltransferase